MKASFSLSQRKKLQIGKREGQLSHAKENDSALHVVIRNTISFSFPFSSLHFFPFHSLPIIGFHRKRIQHYLYKRKVKKVRSEGKRENATGLLQGGEESMRGKHHRTETFPMTSNSKEESAELRTGARYPREAGTISLRSCCLSILGFLQTNIHHFLSHHVL